MIVESCGCSVYFYTISGIAPFEFNASKMHNITVWFNRHFSCVAKVHRELRKEPKLDRLKLVASHKYQTFSAYHTADVFFREPVGLSPDDYLRWVCDTIVEREIHCLVPGHEQSLLTCRSAELQQFGCSVFAAAPSAFIGKLHDKAWVYEQTPEAVPVPKHYAVHHKREFLNGVAAIRDSQRVACVKPATSVYGLGFYRLTPHKRERSTYERTVEQWLEDFAANDAFEKQLVMEYLPGHEYSVDIAARHGTVLACVIRRKPLTPGSQTIVDQRDIQRYVEILVARFQLNGLVNIQFREDHRGQPLLLEINPRASGGIAMSCQGGINLPAIAYRAFLDSNWSPTDIPLPKYGEKVADKEPLTEIPHTDATEIREAESVAVEHLSLEKILPTGTLHISLWSRSGFSTNQLLGFGARNNRKRGFLFVSKVLGKHVPVRPFMMRRVHHELAQQIDQIVSGQEAGGVVLGMAETATGLGMGVFGELQKVSAAAKWNAYFQTTRYRRQGEEVIDSSYLSFEESHSHATQLILELPLEGSVQYRALTQAKRIVLVDDEISTGKTFASLLNAVRRINSVFHEVVVATITDLSGGRVQELLGQVPGISCVHVVSLVAGSFSFVANEISWDVEIADKPVSQSTVSVSQSQWSRYSARRGVAAVPEISRDIVDQCKSKLDRKKCRVIGTNEFMDPAFRLAMELEVSGWEATVQSTTRSPLLVSHEIESKLPVLDLYCPQTPNYLYNFDCGADENLIVVHESSDDTAVRTLIKTLSPQRPCLEVNLLNERVTLHSC